MPVDRYPLGLMLRAACFGAVISAVFGTWLAWLLANREFPGRKAIDAGVLALIALPAPVLSYYLLAKLVHVWPLTNAGLLAASVLAGLPLMTRAARSALAEVDPRYANAARCIGAGGWVTFTRVEAPLAFRSLCAGALLVFARVAAEIALAFWLVDPRP